MKKKSLFILASTALLAAGCSSNSDVENTTDSAKISKIYVDSSTGGDTKTTTNGNSVTWATGDAIGLIEASKPETNNQFILNSAPGTNTGYFEGVTTNDYLSPGTWIAYYPYSATKHNSSNKLKVQTINQTGESNSLLATYDWLISSPVTVGYNQQPSFHLNHSFALIKVTVKLDAAIDDYIELSNVKLSTQDNSQVFAQRIYINDNGTIGFDYTSNNVVTNRTDRPQFVYGNTYTFWLLAKQNAKTPLFVDVYFDGDHSIFSVRTTFNPSNILEAGKLYSLDLLVKYNSDNYPASTLEITNH